MIIPALDCNGDLTSISGEMLVNMFFDETGKLNNLTTKLDNISTNDKLKNSYVNCIIESFFKKSATLAEAYEITIKNMTLRYFGLKIDDDRQAQIVECDNPLSIWINLDPSRKDSWISFIEPHNT